MTAPQSSQTVQPPPTGPLNNHSVSSSVVLKSLSILLGLYFIFIGVMKITPQLSKDLHKDLVSLLYVYLRRGPNCMALIEWHLYIIPGISVFNQVKMKTRDMLFRFHFVFCLFFYWFLTGLFLFIYFNSICLICLLLCLMCRRLNTLEGKKINNR